MGMSEGIYRYEGVVCIEGVGLVKVDGVTFGTSYAAALERIVEFYGEEEIATITLTYNEEGGVFEQNATENLN